MLVLFTDGITEANNSANELYGNDRLRTSLETERGSPKAESVVNAIADDVRRFAGDAPQSDDQTMLAVRYCGPAGKSQP